jgi:hypothetical protein
MVLAVLLEMLIFLVPSLALHRACLSLRQALTLSPITVVCGLMVQGTIMTSSREAAPLSTSASPRRLEGRVTEQ